MDLLMMLVIVFGIGAIISAWLAVKQAYARGYSDGANQRKRIM